MSDDKGKTVLYVVDPLRLSVATTTVIASTCNTTFEALSRQFNERLFKAADAASDREERFNSK